MPLYSYYITCKKTDADRLICSLDYDGSDGARRAYKDFVESIPIKISIENTVETLTRQQFESLLADLDKHSQSDEVRRKNEETKPRLLRRADDAGINEEFSFAIAISQYYQQDGSMYVLRPVHAIELMFDDSIHTGPSVEVEDTSQVEADEVAPPTQEELLALQQHTERLRSEIRNLQMEKAKLEEANSRLVGVNAAIENREELSRMLRDFRVELSQLKKEKDELTRKIMDLSDEIMGLKRTLLKVRHDAEHA